MFCFLMGCFLKIFIRGGDFITLLNAVPIMYKSQYARLATDLGERGERDWGLFVNYLAVR